MKSFSWALVCLSVAAALASALMPACGRVALETGRTGQPGVVRISTRRFDNLNTVVSAGGSSVYLSYLWGAFLFVADDRMRIVPELATEIPTRANGGISVDGRTVTYHLRRGVSWHDGAPFSAADVIFTWRAIMNPANNVVARIGYDKIASIAAPNPYTVVVRLKEPYSPIVASFFGPGEVPFVILPKHLLEGLPDINRAPYNRKPVGTGPFVIQSYDPDAGVVLAANPHYWRGRPKLQGVEYRIVPDTNTEMVMLRAGEIDVAPVSDTHAHELASAPGVVIVSEPAPQNAFLSFNVRRAPLDDIRVRRAIAMAVDRAFFLRAFQYGAGSVDNGDEPPFYWAYDPHVQMPPYDPRAAEQLLDEAGWRRDPATEYRSKAGKPLHLTFAYIASRDPDTRYAPVFQNAMKEVGVAVDLRNYPYNVFYAPASEGGILNGGKYDIASGGWVLGSDPDEATLWMCDQYPPQGYNWSFFCDPRLDALERTALTSYDRNTRRQAYWKVQQLLAHDVPAVFLTWVNIIFATRDTVKDFHPGETWSASWNWRKE
jgi:peptide/nickel transport system substrate-binding protein